MKKATFYLLTFFILCSCSLVYRIDPNKVESIYLLRIDHPYLGPKRDSVLLNPEKTADFLSDFSDRRRRKVKFHSCYIIKIRLENGQLISYRSNGRFLQKLNEESTSGHYFKLNQDINIISKYWGIDVRDFCKP